MLVIPEYAPANGTSLIAKADGSTHRIKLNSELLQGLRENQNFVKELFPAAKMLVYYPMEEE